MSRKRKSRSRKRKSSSRKKSRKRKSSSRKKSRKRKSRSRKRKSSSRKKSRKRKSRSRKRKSVSKSRKTKSNFENVKQSILQKLLSEAEKKRLFVKFSDLKAGEKYRIYLSVDQYLPKRATTVKILSKTKDEAETDQGYAFYKNDGLAVLGTGGDRSIFESNMKKIGKKSASK